jgi:CRP-like cAMP-binding protein
MEWLKPFMTERKYRKGDVLFKRDDAANEMFLTVTGRFLVKEINVELPPGRLMGELGFLSPNNRRTATVECLEDGHVLTITYEKLCWRSLQTDRRLLLIYLAASPEPCCP